VTDLTFNATLENVKDVINSFQVRRSRWYWLCSFVQHFAR